MADESQGDEQIAKGSAAKSPAGKSVATTAPAGVPAVQGDSQDREPAPQEAEPRFSRERLLGPDGVLIAGEQPGVLAGALADADGESFTRAEVATLVENFLTGSPVVESTED